MCITGMALLLLVSAGALLYVRSNSSNFLNLYKIEINRVENEIREAGEEGYIPDISRYETITGVYRFEGDSDELSEGSHNSDAAWNGFFDTTQNYHISDINGNLYRIEYSIDLSKERNNLFRASIAVIAVVFAAVALFLIYIYMTIIRTFARISDYPAQLSKGNLTIPLSEEKNKYFGQFLWGLDMLREKLEEEKKKNLELQKEKNVFLLSLSHDMKTPISAIKLYAAAIKKNLYRDEDKLHEVGEKIESNAEEIEKYVARIISSSGDEFLDLSVKEDEFYLSEAINPIKEYYQDKLKPLGTEFTIESFSDILLRSDKDRLIEVMQNIFENAIKYGDGGYIRMSFADEEDARLITISNSGCTLPENEAEHIFESFYRGSNVGSRPGSGLGLYISRKLIQKMGGEIFSEITGGEMRITLVLHKLG
ncbi:MAG: HAMP domain-containing histidine kinase [Butyrivibrio sp.]|nr:HAMP domain-containing histidine kinase [Butyrivibrio sp.]MBQ7614199.1 HAMP domain-containing histidine kinase [Butyrivibrio sp.]